jgi:hypothetical protein
METCSYWFKFLSETEQKEFRENVKGDWEFLMEHQQEDFGNFVACAFFGKKHHKDMSIGEKYQSVK